MASTGKQAQASGNPQALEHVHHIVAVGSGKGGVGKSTVTVNLAAALVEQGLRVGVLDADIYGPSQPGMLGGEGLRAEARGQVIIPAHSHGIAFVSMGLLLEGDAPAVWRAPIAMKVINQFLQLVDWGELDYLLVDLPPGTGDVQLTLAQQVSLTGAVVVTTPQQVALGVARRGLRMFETVNVPILGVVENMSGFTCSHCGEVTAIFDTGGGEKLAAELGFAHLGSLPLDPAIVASGEQGRPVVIAAPDSKVAEAFRHLARNLQEAVEREGERAAAAPQDVELDPDGKLLITWSDGHRAMHTPYNLRLRCPCAGCVDENTGQRTLKPSQVPLDIAVTGARSVGRYAMAFDFSDGHQTGIYRYDTLRALCECEECARARGDDAQSFSV